MKIITGNKGASLTRASIIAKLKRERAKYGPGITTCVLTDLINWVKGGDERANKRPGGLGK
jgi:hypothetical protein